jgi:dGTPase
MKYPRTSHFAGERHHKFSCLKTEHENLTHIAGELGLIKKSPDTNRSEVEYARHPLAYLVEAADDICYRVLDIEDAIELNLLAKETLKDEFQEILEEEDELKREQKRLLNNPATSWRIKNGLLRGKMIGLMIKEIVHAFDQHYDTIMEGRFGNDLFSSTDGNSLCLSLKNYYREEKLRKKIYQNQKNVPLELGAYTVLRTMLEISVGAAYEIVKSKPPSYRTEIIKKFMKKDGNDWFKDRSLYQVIVLFLDYVTGMTDDFATYMNKQLLGLGN